MVEQGQQENSNQDAAVGATGALNTSGNSKAR